MKQKIPQLNEKTQISFDYYNEFYAREFLVVNRNSEDLKISIQKMPIKTYLEHFNKYLKSDLVNSKNESQIKELDQIVSILNTYGKTDLTIEDFQRYIQRAKKIIYGF